MGIDHQEKRETSKVSGLARAVLGNWSTSRERISGFPAPYGFSIATFGFPWENERGKQWKKKR